MGQKRLRDRPVFYDELKKPRTVTLTETAWKQLKIMSALQGISISELVERWVRENMTDCE